MKLDDALESIRNSNPDPETARAAAGAVRARLGLDEPVRVSGRIENCDGFRARIPDFVAGSLNEAEALLVQDHTRECVPCRRALIAARVGAEVAPRVHAARVVNPWQRYAAAAAAVVIVVLGGWAATKLIPPAPQDLTIAATDGGLWRLDDGTAVLLTAGSSVPETEALRTERGAGAVLRMADGSRIEMRESTQFRVDRRRDGATIRLTQGSIIVEASKQGSGHLDVATGDAMVSVKGTIFTVNAGLSGSRVAVLEGAVQVDSAGQRRLLQPGDQTTSRPGLEPVSLHDAFAWSRDSARYDALLSELSSLRADLEAGVNAPGTRNDSRLLDVVPAGTVIYIGVPNFAAALGDATRIIREHLDRSEELRGWWRESLGSAEAEAELEKGLAKLAKVGRELGDEVVVSFSQEADGRIPGPIFLATLRSPESFRALMEREGLPDASELELRIVGDLLVAGPQGTLPNKIGGPSAFATTPFHERLAEAYRDGTGWIFGADLANIVVGAGESPRQRETLTALGVADARHLIVEREDHGSSARTAATLTFDGPRKGIASWLAEPGPMGGLAFVSPNATFVASILMREPGTAVRELFAGLADADPGFNEALERFKSDSGIDPVADFAGPLGGEVTLALDGPVLPTPAWKFVVEVYDPARLQNAIAIMVERINAQIVAESDGSRGSIALASETVDGRTWHTLRGTAPTGVVSEAVYTFERGYLVAAPNRALVALALQTRESGTGIATSSRFRALLPADRRTDFSAIVFEDVDSLMKPIAGLVGPAVAAKASALTTTGGHLFYAYAEPDRIEIASDTTGGLGAEMARVFALIGLQRPGAVHHDSHDRGGVPVR